MKVKKDFGEKIDPLTSVYRRDFNKKTCQIPKPIKHDPDTSDIVVGPFKDYILPDYLMKNLREPNEYESAGKFYQRLIKEVPSIARLVDEYFDQEYLKRVYEDAKRSAYQIGFCRIEDGFVSKKSLAAKRIKLPPNWGDPPLTTQRKSYRDPRKILGEGESLASKVFKEPPSSFETNPKINEILQIKTGETEYQSAIGHLGYQICKDEYYGKIPLLPNEYVP